MLTGKIALVTGASRGIGRQTAITLASYGATVIVNYNGSKEKAEEVVSVIKENGGNASVYGCNVADFSAVETMMKDIVKEYGALDILVNNAGITKDGLLMKMSEEDYDAVLDINLKGAFNCIKHISRQMLKQKGGRIINLSSVVGVHGNGGQVNYSASKAGIIGITKSVAKELGSRGITVNAVAPGFIVTEMTDAMPEDAKAQVAERIAMKKLGSVNDVAELVAFLASDKAAYITGQVICVDGGMSV
jgi:3-oxoacyl-[acyl-carrier protein] reductase